MKPQMSKDEIKIIEKILLSFSPKVDVLEWGSGGSTVYFTEFLKQEGVSYTWDSIEYNRNWYEKIFNLVKDDKNITITLFDVGNNELKQPNINMDEYVSYPATLNKKYDFIFVDGRKRRRCVLEAKKMLKPDGIVILHDGRRTYYHPAFSAFPDRRILLKTGLWQGKLKDPGIVRKIINSIIYWSFRLYTFSFRLRLSKESK